MNKEYNFKINVDDKQVDTAKNKMDKLAASTDKVSTSASKLGTESKSISTSMKGLGSVGVSSIKGFGKSFQGLGKTIQGVGSTLAANPIFQLVAVITMVIGVIRTLLDWLGLWEVIMDVLGKAVGFVIDLLKELTDWLGFTDNAGDEAHKKAMQRAENRRAAEQILYDSLLSDMEREIALMKSQGASIEEIEEKELELARTKMVTAQEDLKTQGLILDAYIARLEAQGQNTAELQKYRAELINTAKDAETAYEVLNNKIETDRKKRGETAVKTIQETQKREIELQEQTRRKIEDLKIANLADDEEKTLEANRVKYERLIADTIANETILQEQKNELVKQYELARIKFEEDLATTKAEKDEAERVKKEEALKKEFEKYKESNLNEAELLLFKQEQEKELLQQFLDAKLLSQEEYNQKIIDLEKETAEKIKDINEKTAEEIAQAKMDSMNSQVDMVENYTTSAGNLLSGLSSLSNDLGKEDEKSQLARAKRNFNMQKALNLVTAGVDGAKSVLKAIAEFGPPPSPLGIAAIASAGVISAAQLAAIASSNFDGEASSSSTPSMDTAITAPQTQTSVPQYDLYETGLNSTGSKTTSREAKDTSLRAYVTETDIYETGRRLGKIRGESEL